jgi:hypothetical protein
MSPADYTVVADCLALATRDFAEEITAIRALITTLEARMQEEVRSWVDSALVTPTAAPHVIREMVLTRFVDPEAVAGGHQEMGEAAEPSDGE